MSSSEWGAAYRGDPPARRSGVIFAEVDDGAVLYDPDRREVHVLNVSGADVWSRLDGRLGIDGIGHAIAADYGAPPDIVTQDVQRLVEDLTAAHLIVPASETVDERDQPDLAGFIADPPSPCPEPFRQEPLVYTAFAVAGHLVGVRSNSPHTDRRVREVLGDCEVVDAEGPANFNVLIQSPDPEAIRHFATLYRGRCALVRSRHDEVILQALRRAALCATADDNGLVHAAITAVVGSEAATLLPSSLRTRLEREGDELRQNSQRLLPAPYVALDPRDGAVVDLEEVDGRLVEVSRHPVARILLAGGSDRVYDWQTAVRLMMPDVIREPRVVRVRALAAMVEAAQSAAIGAAPNGGSIMPALVGG